MVNAIQTFVIKMQILASSGSNHSSPGCYGWREKTLPLSKHYKIPQRTNYRADVGVDGRAGGRRRLLL